MGCWTRVAAAICFSWACGVSAQAPAGPVLDAGRFGQFTSEKIDHAPIISRAMQAARDAGGGVVKVPPGTYWVAVDASGAALTVPAGVYLDLRGVELRLIENDLPAYHVVLFNAGPSGMQGGTIVGDRDRHLGTKGEWGHCVSILGATKVTIQDTKVFKCWGDGFLVAYPPDRREPSRQVVIDGVEAGYNRRNNISIVSADGFRISNAYVHNAKGTSPESGIDLEPDDDCVVVNGELVNIRLERNARYGLVMGGEHGPIDNIMLDRVYATQNVQAGLWLQAVRDVRGRRVRTFRNGREGMVLLRSPRVSLAEYESTGNREPDKHLEK